MGYLHRGMLPEGLQEQLDGLQRGSLSGAIQLLEGIAIIRLEDRREPRLRGFEEVRPRVAELLQRERAAETWQQLIAGLRKDAAITIDWSQHGAAHAGQAASGAGGSER
jgi:parvulin-like peptidyl-prolyl isomerase